jgi:RNA polymerase sigma-70 factor (ECF subfamily)
MRDDVPPGREAEVVELLATYGSAMRRLAGVYAPDPTDQDDVVQEIAIAVWKAWPRFRRDSSERTWIYRIAHNVASTFRSKRQRVVGDAPLDDVADARDASLDRRLDLVGLVRTLPAVDRQIVTLYLEGLTGAEIAAVTGLSASNVGVRLTRARRTLQAAARGDQP